MTEPTIRVADAADLPAIQAIYANHVLHGTGSFEEAPPSVEVMTTRFEEAAARDWGWMVATDASGVLGFATYSQYRASSGYRFTAEDSVYVRDDVRSQGVGKALVAAIVKHAQKQGFRQMIAVIGDAENVASIGVHASLGFHRVGTLHKVGFKLERWLDVVLMQRDLTI
jgi:phosphinothricin acetyltransferase